MTRCGFTARARRNTRLSNESLEFALSVSILDGSAFVVQFFALGEADLYLGESFFVEPDLKGNEGVTLVFQFIDQFFDLSFTKEQFTFPRGRVVGIGAVFVFGDVQIAQPYFFPVDGAEAVVEAGLSAAQGFDLGTGQYHTRIVLVLDEIFVECGTVPDLHAESGLDG